ncbi:hypothetical protein [Epilithonimonas sp.]|uniref:hypothetical protein n=1 Tax=Epilithonimonas sp. TaxID=2894511 RepID=UPI002FDCD529
MSKFSSNFYGAGIRINAKDGIFGISRLNMQEIWYGHYMKSIRMKPDINPLNLGFK